MKLYAYECILKMYCERNNTSEGEMSLKVLFRKAVQVIMTNMLFKMHLEKYMLMILGKVVLAM